MRRINSEADLSVQRANQLSLLSEVEYMGSPILVHGSIAHALAIGDSVPPVYKPSGELRDIDVFAARGGSKSELEAYLHVTASDSPAPVDAGLCGLLIGSSEGNLRVSKSGIEADLVDGEEVFHQTKIFQVNGCEVRSFTPLGLLAVHSLEPKIRNFTHRAADRRFVSWCQENGVVLPDRLRKSIDEFHREYRSAYPLAIPLQQTADIYARTLPESLRPRFRRASNFLMTRYGAREATN
jgi:hypothetical protein